jgi:hypothetical protein
MIRNRGDLRKEDAKCCTTRCAAEPDRNDRVQHPTYKGKSAWKPLLIFVVAKRIPVYIKIIQTQHLLKNRYLNVEVGTQNPDPAHLPERWMLDHGSKLPLISLGFLFSSL